MIESFRALSNKLADKMLVPAQLETVSGGNDRLTGRRETNKNRMPCKAIVGLAKRENSNGILTMRSVATITIKPNIGDRLYLGSSSYTFETVEEIAPDGNAIIWRGVVK